MTLPEGYEKWVGRGTKHTIGDIEYEAYPLTIEEYIEYLSLRPESTIEGEGDDRKVIYASKADETKELLAMAYVFWATIRKQDETIESFTHWKQTSPGFMMIGEYAAFASEVLMATADPIKKKN